MATLAPGAVFPETVIVEELVRVSSSGEERLRDRLLVGEEVGVGVPEVSAVSGVGVGVGLPLGISLRLLLAVQMPKVIIKPKINPMEMAKKTSFFIQKPACEINLRGVYCQVMEVTFLGHAAFKIKGKNSTVVTDPYDAKVSKFPKDVDANIVTVSHQHLDHNAVSQVVGKPFVVEGPGEYEVGGVSIIGVATWHDDQAGKERGANTAYVIEMDGLRLLHLGDLGHKLSEEQLEEMGAIDVVFVPVGGFYTIDAKTASEVVKQLDPWVVVPMHYSHLSTDPGISAKLAGVEIFLKEMGKLDVVPQPKLVISEDKLPTEMQVVVLERK